MKTDRRKKSSDKVCDNVVEGKAPREKRTLNRSLGDIPAFFLSRGSAGGSGKFARRISEPNRRKKA